MKLEKYNFLFNFNVTFLCIEYCVKYVFKANTYIKVLYIGLVIENI